MPEEKEFEFQIGAMGEAVWVSEKYPMIKFFRKGPASRNDCLYCRGKATLIADLGTNERRCCDKSECMDKAAEDVWQYLCLEAKFRGFSPDFQGVHDYLVYLNNKLGNKLTPSAKSICKELAIEANKRPS